MRFGFVVSGPILHKVTQQSSLAFPFLNQILSITFQELSVHIWSLGKNGIFAPQKPMKHMNLIERIYYDLSNPDNPAIYIEA